MLFNTLQHYPPLSLYGSDQMVRAGRWWLPICADVSPGSSIGSNVPSVSFPPDGSRSGKGTGRTESMETDRGVVEAAL